MRQAQSKKSKSPQMKGDKRKGSSSYLAEELSKQPLGFCLVLQKSVPNQFIQKVFFLIKGENPQQFLTETERKPINIELDITEKTLLEEIVKNATLAFNSFQIQTKVDKVAEKLNLIIDSLEPGYKKMLKKMLDDTKEFLGKVFLFIHQNQTLLPKIQPVI